MTSKHFEIIEKTEAAVQTTSTLNDNSIRAISLRRKLSLTVSREIVGNCYFKYNLVRILLKQLDYELEISTKW